MLEADFSHQKLKAIASDGRSAGVALILIDDADVLLWPTESERAPCQIILPRCTAGVIADLDHG